MAALGATYRDSLSPEPPGSLNWEGSVLSPDSHHTLLALTLRTSHTLSLLSSPFPPPETLAENALVPALSSGRWSRCVASGP